MSNIEEIKSKLDIVDVVSSYVPDLKQAGVNFKSRCPFHSEKSPSFTVNPSLQIYKCFGCGKAGDVINFIQEIEHTDFVDALNIAAEKAGVEIKRDSKGFDSKEKLEKENLLNANLLTAKFYNYILLQHKSGKKGLDYALEKRKLNHDILKKFMVGFAPNKNDNLKNFLVSKGFNIKDLIKWGLLVERKGVVIDKFRDRLMQPIFNLKGEVVAFSGRYLGTIKEAPKYLNSPETLVYKKNEMLYGLSFAKEFLKDSNFLILVEGNIDILSSHKLAIGNIVAPLGTAFTVNQAKLIKRFSEYVYFCFDSDEAGLKALIRSMGIAEDIELKHKVIDVSGFQDADDLIKADPLEWPKRIAGAKSTMDYLIEKFAKDLDLFSAEGKSIFESRIIPVLSLVKDEVLFNHYRKTIATILEVSEEFVNSKSKSKNSYTNTKFVAPKSVEVNLPVSINIDSSEKYFLELLIALDKMSFIKFDSINFLSDVKTIFEVLKNNPDKSFDQLVKLVDNKLESIFDEIVMNGLNYSETKDSIELVKEINKKGTILRRKYLDRRNKIIAKEKKVNFAKEDLIEELDKESNSILEELKVINKGNFIVVE